MLPEQAIVNNDAPDAQTIDICVCTFRRAHIADTLRSLAKLALPLDWHLRVIVADNDDTPTAEMLVKATAVETHLSVLYIHAPACNISIARNVCLEAATATFIAFLDDDELAEPQWLSKLLDVAHSTHADVVLGPVKAFYTAQLPEWLSKGDFHATLPVWVGGQIITGYTCNVLFKRLSPTVKDHRFELELGRSGGEDTTFFSNIYKAGGKIAYAPDAVVTEAVTPERATLKWLLKRRFRSGQTHGLLISAASGSPVSIVKNVVIAGVKAFICFAASAIFIFDSVATRRWLLRGSLHLGVISSLLGKRSIEQYGSAHVR